MENFIVSARKYRPVTFQSVIGQPSITNTLKSAIKTKHLAHAYLFCGPRGVGKTTCARIFAKTINCSNLGADYEACNECESCKSFNENRSYSIHEMDAASNNSVEDIRLLIDKVRIPPQIGKHSLYIIDEVHMLSAQAFNAFLKTLEEPPAHAIFILATTEKHKILPTILSRCQIFDFNRIRVEDIVNHLMYVAKSENITVDPEALNIIAQKADGGMRDALSTFDQLVSFAGNNLSYKSVIENLNVLDYDYYFKLIDAFLSENFETALLIFDEVLNDGFDGQHFISGLNKHFRDLIVCKFPGTIKLLEVGAAIGERYLSQSASCEVDFLYRGLDLTNQCDVTYKTSRNQRLLVELTLIKLCKLLKKKELELEDNTTDKQKTTRNQPLSRSIEAKATPVYKVGQTPTVSIREVNTKAQELKLENEVSLVKPELGQNQTPAKKMEPPDTNQVSEPEKVMEIVEFRGLEDIFLKFAEKYKSVKPRLHNLLISCQPKLLENKDVELTFDNPLQAEDFDSIKKEIEPQIKLFLNTSGIQFQIKYTEKKNDARMYSVSEKYNLLIQKNENLLKLKQKFNLDF